MEINFKQSTGIVSDRFCSQLVGNLLANKSSTRKI